MTVDAAPEAASAETAISAHRSVGRAVPADFPVAAVRNGETETQPNPRPISIGDSIVPMRPACDLQAKPKDLNRRYLAFVAAWTGLYHKRNHSGT